MIPMLLQILRTGIVSEPAPAADESLRATTQQLSAAMTRQLGRALVIRHVDAGSCNGCELEIHALNNPYYNLEAIGIKFAVKRAYDATPEPKLVVAVGDCGCSGGIFGESYASCGRVSNIIPVDVSIPGCPPTPLQLMQGILAAIAPASDKAT